MTQDFSSVVGGLAPGEQIAGYQVQEQIGRGGMAMVYRALDLRLGRQVALKVLAPHLIEDEAFRQRFIRESRAAAGVDHPHIVPVFEAGEADGVLFIAMRYVSYGDVRMLIDREGRLSPARTAAITTQVASALDAAHARGLVHRDVKPGNMLLAETGGSGTDHVYLSDFGLSKHSLAPSTLTAAGQFMGTLDYVSPEQIQGHPADGRADQYALACTAMEMLSGSPPFKRDESMALLWAQLEAPPPLLTERRPDLPPVVDEVMRTALAKSPADRYPSCLAFAAALRTACEPSRATLRVPELAAPVPAPNAPAPQPAAPSAGPKPDVRPVPVRGAQGSATAGPMAAPRMPTARPPAPVPQPSPGQRPPGGGTRPLGPQPPRQSQQRRSGKLPAVLIAVAVIAVLIAVGSRLFHHGGTTSPPAASQTTGDSLTSPASPARTVRAYFAAINHHRYRLAWQLVGRGNSGGSYQKFVAGFAGTARDQVTVLSTSGNVVSARLKAFQTNGTVKTFEGSYTVTNGVITESNVQRTS